MLGWLNHFYPSFLSINYFRYLYIKDAFITVVFKKCKGDKGRTFDTQMCMPYMLLYIELEREITYF